MKKLLIALVLSTFLSACAGAEQKPERRTNFNQIPVKSSAAKPSKSKMSCYDIGYKWGVCAAKNTADKSCKPDKDAVIPDRCIDEPITQQGIKDGVRSIQKRVFEQQY